MPHSGCTYELTGAWSGAEPTSGTASGALQWARGAVDLKVKGSWEGSSVELTQATETVLGRAVSSGALEMNLEGIALPGSGPQGLDLFFEQFGRVG